MVAALRSLLPLLPLLLLGATAPSSVVVEGFHSPGGSCGDARLPLSFPVQSGGVAVVTGSGSDATVSPLFVVRHDGRRSRSLAPSAASTSADNEDGDGGGQGRRKGVRALCSSLRASVRKRARSLVTLSALLALATPVARSVPASAVGAAPSASAAPAGKARVVSRRSQRVADRTVPTVPSTLLVREELMTLAKCSLVSTSLLAGAAAGGTLMGRSLLSVLDEDEELLREIRERKGRIAEREEMSREKEDEKGAGDEVAAKGGEEEYLEIVGSAKEAEEKKEVVEVPAAAVEEKVDTKVEKEEVKLAEAKAKLEASLESSKKGWRQRWGLSKRVTNDEDSSSSVIDDSAVASSSKAKKVVRPIKKDKTVLFSDADEAGKKAAEDKADRLAKDKIEAVLEDARSIEAERKKAKRMKKENEELRIENKAVEQTAESLPDRSSLDKEVALGGSVAPVDESKAAIAAPDDPVEASSAQVTTSSASSVEEAKAELRSVEAEKLRLEERDGTDKKELAEAYDDRLYFAEEVVRRAEEYARSLEEGVARGAEMRKAAEEEAAAEAEAKAEAERVMSETRKATEEEFQRAMLARRLSAEARAVRLRFAAEEEETKAKAEAAAMSESRRAKEEEEFRRAMLARRLSAVKAGVVEVSFDARAAKLARREERRAARAVAKAEKAEAKALAKAQKEAKRAAARAEKEERKLAKQEAKEAAAAAAVEAAEAEMAKVALEARKAREEEVRRSMLARRLAEKARPLAEEAGIAEEEAQVDIPAAEAPEVLELETSSDQPAEEEVAVIPSSPKEEEIEEAVEAIHVSANTLEAEEIEPTSDEPADTEVMVPSAPKEAFEATVDASAPSHSPAPLDGTLPSPNAHRLDQRQLSKLHRRSERRRAERVRDVELARIQPKSDRAERKLDKRYGAMTSLEDRAFAVLLDLGMVEITPDPMDEEYDPTYDDELAKENVFVKP